MTTHAIDARPGSTGGPFGLMALQAVTELRAGLRTPEFAVGAVAIPVILYAMFGLPNADSELPAGGRIGTAMLASLACYGVVSLAIFVFGEDVAKDRGRGWLRTLRATPFPTSAYLVGKAGAAVVYATLIVVALGLLGATAGGVRLELTEWAAFAGLLLLGVLAFSPLGFAIAYLAQPRAAAVIANVVFLPLSFASGFFVPLSQLPPVMSDVAAVLPTFHFGQLVYPVVLPADDVAAFTGAATQAAWVHVAWVVAWAVLFAAGALWAARREAVTRRG